MKEVKTCAFPGCETAAAKWYLHIGVGIRFLCIEHFNYFYAQSIAKKIQFPHGEIGTVPTAKEIKESWKTQK